MNWDPVIQYVTNAVLLLLLGAMGFGAKMFIGWLRAHDNTVLHTIGELAYQQIEKNYAGSNGAFKMQLAIEEVRKRIDGNGRLKNVSDDKIIEAINRGWYQNEGQYK